MDHSFECFCPSGPALFTFKTGSDHPALLCQEYSCPLIRHHVNDTGKRLDKPDRFIMEGPFR